MICCDVCAVVLGKTKDPPIPGQELFFIGHWEICEKCLDRHVELIFDDIKNKRFRRN